MKPEFQDTRGYGDPDHRDARAVRPDPGRGNIVSSHAEELQRHKGVGRERSQIGRSLVDRITMSHKGQVTRGRGHASSRGIAIDRIFADGSGGGTVRLERGIKDKVQDDNPGSVTPVRNHPKFLPGDKEKSEKIDDIPQRKLTHVEHHITAAHGESGQGTQATLHDAGSHEDSTSIFVPHTENAITTQIACNPVSGMFSAASAPKNIKQEATTTQRSRIPWSSASDKENNVPKRKPGRVTKPKDPFNRIANPKLRALMKGVKPRPTKRTDGPLLRMGQVAMGVQGHELVCSSSPDGDLDVEQRD